MPNFKRQSGRKWVRKWGKGECLARVSLFLAIVVLEQWDCNNNLMSSVCVGQIPSNMLSYAVCFRWLAGRANCGHSVPFCHFWNDPIWSLLLFHCSRAAFLPNVKPVSLTSSQWNQLLFFRQILYCSFSFCYCVHLRDILRSWKLLMGFKAL